MIFGTARDLSSQVVAIPMTADEFTHTGPCSLEEFWIHAKSPMHSSTEFWLIANTDVTQIVGQFRGKERVGDVPLRTLVLNGRLGRWASDVL
jgi:hypothetical protein